MTRSWKRALVLLTLLVGCDHAPPIVDGCHAACECWTFFDSDRARCEQSCQTAAADPQDNPGIGDCLQCADDSATCSDFQRDCQSECRFSGLSSN